MADLMRGYSKTEFERQYNARLWTPDCESKVQVNVERSEDVRASAPYHADIGWGPKSTNGLDLFVPSAVMDESARRDAELPVVLFIHGGYWRSREKSSFSFMSAPLVDAGAIVAVTDYSLCPSVALADIVEEMRLLGEWLQRNVAQYGGRPDALHVVGHSAGGHLAAMLALTDWRARSSDLSSDFIRSVTPISGLFELEPLLSHSVNDDLKMNREQALALSPALLDASAVMAPIDVYVGTAESDEFRRQSVDFASAWASAGATVSCAELSGHDHFTILSALADPEFDITQGLIRRIKASL